jgi:hypothetical protein
MGTLAFVLVVGATMATWLTLQLRPVDAGDTVERTFEVEPGWQAHRVATELEEAGLVRDDLVMEAWLRLRGLERQIGAGLYDLAPSPCRTSPRAWPPGGDPARRAWCCRRGSAPRRSPPASTPWGWPRPRRRAR